jgi:hypothetical protein
MQRILLSIITITALGFGAKAQNVNLPDANFKASLVGDVAINTNGDTEIQVSEASAFTGQIDCSGLSVADLTGIETFTSLTRLYCSDNSLNTLDLSQNIALIWLFCYNNSLTSLDLSTNTALTRLWCYNNSLNTLDVSQSTGLAWLYCYDNYLSSLDVSNSALTQFNCMNNSLTSLNVSNGNNMNITTSNFGVVNNPNLTCIEVDDVAWSTTNWTNIDAASSFSTNCSACVVNIPDANFKTYLVGNTAINTNGDTEIQCSEANAFSGQIDCFLQNISDLTGIEAFISLTDLRCNNNSISSLNLTQNTALTYLNCSSNSITSLDLTQNTFLINLYFQNNLITTLDLTLNTALTKLVCFGNSLNTLDVSNNTALEILYCYNNSLSVLDVSNNNLITELKCHQNYTISALDVSNMASLNTLTCTYNSLASLDVSNNTQLTSFDCGNNVITSLNMSNNNAITFFSCHNNSLNSLNMANGNNVNIPTGNFYTTNNPNLTCVEVDDVAWSTTNWANIDATASFSTNCSVGVGIDEQANNINLSIYPNPVNNQFTIEAEEQIKSINIIDITGKTVKTLVPTSNTIDASDLTKGIYLLQVQTNKGLVSKKFIKE